MPFTESLPVPVGDDGRPFVDGWLRVAGAPPGTVYGLGDAFSCIPNGESEAVPQTAQVAGCVEIKLQAPHVDGVEVHIT